MPSNPAIGEGFEEAKPWEEALNFTGAWDYAYIVTFLKDRNIEYKEFRYGDNKRDYYRVYK